MDLASDELTRPLGLDPAPERRRLPRPHLAALGAALALAAFAGALYAIRSDPLAGVPHALVPIEDRPSAATSEASAGARPREAPSDAARRTAADLEAASGVSVIRGDGASAPGALVLPVPDEASALRLNPAPDARLVERTRHGALPRIGRDGARASVVYARPPGALPRGVQPAGRVALLVGGLGLSEAGTDEALAKLPPAVTLAFAPYGRGLEAQVVRARELGHEVMLQVPMEPFDYPANDPGPHTLTAGARAHENLDKLHWMMARFPGYVGIVNFMGAKLTASDAALAPVLRDIGSRGLAFVDDGSSPRSTAAEVGPRVRTPTVRADLVVDAVARADAIDKELARLEARARDRGFALGSASALPVTLERVARWARELEGRGILLVPVSTTFDAAASP